MDVERHERIESIGPEWDELADRSGALPWLRPGWAESWCEAFGEKGLEILAARRDGRLAGLVPLVRRRGGLVSMTNWHTPEWGVLAEDRAAIEELVGELFRRRPARLDVAFLPAGGPAAIACRGAARQARYRVLERTHVQSPYIEMTEGWDAYRRRLRGKMLANVRRRRRRLEETGQVSVEICDGNEDVGGTLEEAFRVEASGWKGERREAIGSRPETRRFYTGIAHWAASRGWLRVPCLRLDGRLLAFQLNIQDHGRLHTLKVGYDDEFHRYSPGTLLLYDVLEHGFSTGLERFEFLGADGGWKLEWTDTSHELTRLQAFAPSPGGLAALAAFRYGRPLAKRALAKAASLKPEPARR